VGGAESFPWRVEDRGEKGAEGDEAWSREREKEARRLLGGEGTVSRRRKKALSISKKLIMSILKGSFSWGGGGTKIVCCRKGEKLKGKAATEPEFT